MELRIKVIKIIKTRLKNNDVVTPLIPNSGTERNREINRFLMTIKKVIKTVKFLCSENIICLKALYGSSIINCIVFHKSMFTTLSLR